MSSPNIFDFVNQQIFDFVQQPENHALMPGTGWYSTPFRGKLFGFWKTAEVVEQLKARPIEVLWLGSNPNAPQSLAKMINPQTGESDFPLFVKQMTSGWFSSWHWVSQEQEDAYRDWNPIQEPKGSWAVYRDIIGNIASIDAVTMANFLPWGSQNLDALMMGVGAISQPLLGRIIRFSDELNREIVKALQPRLLLVPFSLARNRTIEIHDVGLTMQQATQRRDHAIKTDAQTFNFTTSICAQGVPAVYLPHPSYLRVTENQRRSFVDEVSAVLARFIGV